MKNRGDAARLSLQFENDGLDDDNQTDEFFEYSYDPENRLTGVDYDPGTGTLTAVARYRYDPQGRRIEFINSPPGGVTSTIYYYHDGSAGGGSMRNVIAEYAYDSGWTAL